MGIGDVVYVPRFGQAAVVLQSAGGGLAIFTADGDIRYERATAVWPVLKHLDEVETILNKLKGKHKDEKE